jgi:glycosyltransferase involved in cell wall biosynthesis
MPREIYLVLLEFGQTHEQPALDLLIPTVHRLFPGAGVRTVVVDNARSGHLEQAIDTEIARVSGDNRLREFSGWDRGMAWLARRYAPAPGSIVVLANDTVVRPEKHDRVRDTPADRAAAAFNGALVGWVDEYPRPVELFGLTFRQWIDTSFAIAEWRTWTALGPLAHPLANERLFADDWQRIFHEPSPLSENYRAYLKAYFFGGPADPEFLHRWYAHEPVNADNFEAFKAKLRSVVCEHLLSARARTRGIPLIDIRSKPFTIDGWAPRHLPRVSVIMPCYDLGRYLNEAVDSVLAQTDQDFELLIVDDGSTDPATQAVLADYRRPNTRVIRTPHGGVSTARNVAIANARGAYLCALDADDRLEPTFFEKAVPVLEADPSLSFVSCWLRTFGDEEWDWKPERCDLPTLLWEDTVLTAALVRRSAVEAVGGYDTQIPIQGAEDWELWLTLVERGYRGVILREVLFNYRRRAGSLSAVSWYGTGHLPLTSYRVGKHADSYRTFLVDVLLHQDGEIAPLLRHNDELERYITTELEPAVAARRAELATLQARLASLTAAEPVPPSPSTDDLRAALGAAELEVIALRRSMSWRLTRPLRDVYGWWLRRRGFV